MGQKKTGEIATQCSPENAFGPHEDAVKAITIAIQIGYGPRRIARVYRPEPGYVFFDNVCCCRHKNHY